MVNGRSRNIMGIDIGSVSIAVIEMTPEKKIVKAACLSHKGKPAEKLMSLLAKFNPAEISTFVSTASTPDNIRVIRQYDNQLALIAAARHFHKKPGSLLHVGGEKFGLIFFDKEGNYLKSKTNTSCAAGTGSFLDQQAHRDKVHVGYAVLKAGSDKGGDRKEDGQDLIRYRSSTKTEIDCQTDQNITKNAF